MVDSCVAPDGVVEITDCLVSRVEVLDDVDALNSVVDITDDRFGVNDVERNVVVTSGVL